MPLAMRACYVLHLGHRVPKDFEQRTIHWNSHSRPKIKLRKQLTPKRPENSDPQQATAKFFPKEEPMQRIAVRS